MRARDIMVKPVLTAKPSTTVAELAKMLSDNRISGVPVVDDSGAVVGIVSETDLLHRRETGTERRRKWWMRMLLDSDTLARDFVKTHSTKVADIMSPFVVTVSADAKLRHVADVLESSEIKRVPVMENGKLAGMITRGDLVRALTQRERQDQPAPSDDIALQKRIMEKIAGQPWLDQTYLSVTVTDGVAEIAGFVTSETQLKALRIMVEEAGAKTYKDHVKVGKLRLYAV